MKKNRGIQPARKPQGARNETGKFQTQVEQLFTDRSDNINVWLDDFMLHGKYGRKTSTNLGKVFWNSFTKAIESAILKSNFFIKKVCRCGPIIGGIVARHDLRKIEWIARYEYANELRRVMWLPTLSAMDGKRHSRFLQPNETTATNWGIGRIRKIRGTD